MVPTYQESANIGPLLDALLALPMDLTVLVVDDNSPDGTADIVRRKARNNARVRLLLRKDKRGRGYAGVDGMREALRLGADYVIEMDADFSHPPQFLPHFLPALADAGVVIASRRVPGGGDTGRGPLRKAITALSCAWISWWLALPVKDGTTGFRCYSRAALEKLDWDGMRSDGPAILQEMLLSLHKAGVRMREIPFVFQPRAAGTSQLNFRKLLKSLYLVTILRFQPPRLRA